jgi:hypothetical protein
MWWDRLVLLLFSIFYILVDGYCYIVYRVICFSKIVVFLYVLFIDFVYMKSLVSV